MEIKTELSKMSILKAQRMHLEYRPEHQSFKQ